MGRATVVRMQTHVRAFVLDVVAVAVAVAVAVVSRWCVVRGLRQQSCEREMQARRHLSVPCRTETRDSRS